MTSVRGRWSMYGLLLTTKRRLRSSLSTIKRELARNKGAREYRAKQAHSFAQKRHQQKTKAIKMVTKLKARIIDDLHKQWSPEQIQGRLKKEGQSSVCPATIYLFIWENKAEGGCLHSIFDIRSKWTGKPDPRGQIRNRVSIDARPKIVDQKIRLGDWEADTVIGKVQKGVLVTLTERASKFNLVKRVPSKHADVVTKAIIAMLKSYQPN
jgi:IS30 family transposase